MLIALKQVIGSSIEGADGRVGATKDVYFDGRSWEIRYIVVDTGRWIPGKQVLLTPADIDRADWGMRRFYVRHTKEQVRNAPHIDNDKPVSRQMEVELAAYYGWPAYWEGAAVMGSPIPAVVGQPPVATSDADHDADRQHVDPLLRSFDEVKNYRISAVDDDIGHVTEMIVDDNQWLIRYLVVETGNWLPDRRVLVSPEWVDQIRWEDRRVVVAMTREAVKNSPEFQPHAPVNREYEEQLYDYYGKRKYW